MISKNKVIRILGIRGIPAAHGGFETFAEYLSKFLVARGWRVIVYCQEDAAGNTWEDEWQGVERIHIPVNLSGPLGTIVFDWKSISHALQSGAPCLTLGYNTAIFSAALRAKGVRNVINMDGIEWSRAKWGRLAKSWFWINDWAGCWLGNHLIADHPEIKIHLSTRVDSRKITTIAYGAEEVVDADVSVLGRWGLNPGKFLTLIARAEPENSILEVVKGFSEKKRNLNLVVLGNYSRGHDYQKMVLDSASDEVLFVGAIYEKEIVQSLRFYSLAYVHGHQVGGTNPSLVEALGAGNAVIAHDNKFNKWVAGDSARYFNSSESFSGIVDEIISHPEIVVSMQQGSFERFKNGLTWPYILSEYEALLEKFQ